MRVRGRVTAVVFSLALIATLLAAGPAAAQTNAAQTNEEPPPFIPWSALLPTLTAGYNPSSSNICVSGRIRCIDAVIKEMEDRFNRLASTCDHDAVFELTYLRTTEEFKRASTTPGFFSDPPFMNHHAAVFASYYFKAYDDWHAGRKTKVPQAWRIALDAADKQQVSAAGNLLLGMSAHVNRDLPYVLAEIGLVKPDGTTRKRDHDQVNRFLNKVTEPLIAEVGRRLDPSINNLDVKATHLDATTLFQLIQAWREVAWRNAELLVNTKNSPLLRKVVETEIETHAATVQTALRTTYALLSPLKPDARNAWCQAHWRDP